MKAAPRTPSNILPMAPSTYSGVRIDLWTPALSLSDGQPLGCLRCTTAPCTTMTDETGALSPVCPTDAIGAMTESGISIDAETCIGCGVCLLRCPAGAIYFTDILPSTVAVQTPQSTSCGVDELQHRLAVSKLNIESSAARLIGQEFVAGLVASAEHLTQKPFYRLVADLFILAGFQAELGHGGDTSSRFDLLLPDLEDSLPVEIKSRTETASINVKSVQQAVENKIILDNRSFAAQAGSSTLVVGWDYPPPRSEVHELIEDIFCAFGINVGIISLSALYRLAIDSTLNGVVHRRSLLNTLRGAL